MQIVPSIRRHLVHSGLAAAVSIGAAVGFASGAAADPGSPQPASATTAAVPPAGSAHAGAHVGLLGAWVFSAAGGDDHRHVRVLDLPLFTLASVEHEDGHDRVAILDTLPFTAFARSEGPDSERTTIFDAPLFELYTASREPERSEVAFFDLPLLGALYRRETAPGSVYNEVLFLIRWRERVPVIIQTRGPSRAAETPRAIVTETRVVPASTASAQTARAGA